VVFGQTGAQVRTKEQSSMIRFCKVLFLLAPAAQLLAQSLDDSRAVTLSALEYSRQDLARRLPARVFQNAVIRVDNVFLGTEGSAKEIWVSRLAVAGGARPVDGPVCGGEPGTFGEMWRARCALKQATLYLEVESPTITGDSATTRVHSAWLDDSNKRSPFVYSARCLRLARASTGWLVVRTCGVSAT
jgi:hypothetical protein